VPITLFAKGLWGEGESSFFCSVDNYTRRVCDVRTQKSTIKLFTTTAVSSLITLDLVYKLGKLFLCHASLGMLGCKGTKLTSL
jgi:hypothetical protein